MSGTVESVLCILYCAPGIRIATVCMRSGCTDVDVRQTGSAGGAFYLVAQALDVGDPFGVGVVLVDGLVV